MIKTPMITIVGQHAPPEIRGAAIGTLMGFMSLGFATGPVVSGVLYDLDVVTSDDGFSYLPFIVGVIVATIGAVNMFVVERLTRSEREEKNAAKLEVNSGLLATNDGESGVIPRMGSSLMLGTSFHFDDVRSGDMPREKYSFRQSLEGMALSAV